ncbi:MAG: hypothetical protein LBM00_05555 [Deltaproteobacteria bacterium]|jgi:hypothetical protein|nr:hypothetical protein [Deltaproteobacteria bacterium]
MLCNVLTVSSAWADQWPPEDCAWNSVEPLPSVQNMDLICSSDLDKAVLGNESLTLPEKPSEQALLVTDAEPAVEQPEQNAEERIINLLKDVSTSNGKGKPDKPAPARPANPGENPKDRQISYNKDTDSFRVHVESPEWQRAFSDRRSFGAFARNYTNRIHCDGVIADVIYPTTKGLELELKNKGHDLFIQVGSAVPSDISYFPVDLNIVCQGEVFQINAVVDTQYAGTNMELVLNGGVSPETLRPYESSILKAQALPHEERLVKILTRVWNRDYLPYWVTKKIDSSCAFSSPCKLSTSIDTGISGVIAWDFLAPSNAAIPELLAKLSQHVTGEIIGIGRVHLREAQRVIILSVANKAEKK